MPVQPIDRSLSVLCVHQGFELYGSDRIFLQSLRLLHKRFPSWRLTVLIPRPGPLADALSETVDRVELSDLLVLRRQSLKRLRPSDLPAAIRRVLAARRRIRRHDLVLISTVTVLDYILATRATRTPSVIHVHECVTGLQRVFFSLLLNISRTSIIFNSRATRRSYWLFPWRSSGVVYNSCAAPSGSARGPDLSDRHGGELRVLMLGRLSPRKGQILLLESLARLRTVDRDRIAVRIVGDAFGDTGKPRRAIEATREELELRDKVSIEPFTKDTDGLYDWADLVVVPSLLPESFGMVAVEAMARQLPVAAAAHGGLTEVVADGVTGRLFPPGSVTALAAVLSDYLADPITLREHGRAGFERYRALFDETAFERGFLERIDRALADGDAERL